MNILIITQFFPPEPVELYGDLALSLQSFGHKVQVITGFPNYPAGKIYKGYKLRPWMRENINGMQVIRVPLFPDRSNSKIRRMANYISFALSATLFAPFLTNKPDIIYAAHTPSTLGIPAYILSRLWRIPFVSTVVDLWPESLESMGYIPKGICSNFIKWAETFIYGKSSYVRVITPGLRANLLNKGVPSEKILFIPEWADTETFRPVEYNKTLADDLGLSGKFNIVYTGNIGYAQGLDKLIDTAYELKNIKSLQLVFVGDGMEVDRIKKEVLSRGLNNIKFVGRVPKEQMSDIFSIADVLFLSLADKPVFRITIPHKLYAYLAGGKPILASVEGDSADLIESAKAGLVCSPSNPKDIADKIRIFLSLSKEDLLKMGQNGRDIAVKRYSRDIIVKQISDMLIKIVARSNRECV